MAIAMRIRQVREVEVPGLGARIKAAREAIAATKSVVQICAEVGVSRQYWYALEQERATSLSFDNLKRIEAVLGVDLGVEFGDR